MARGRAARIVPPARARRNDGYRAAPPLRSQRSRGAGGATAAASAGRRAGGGGGAGGRAPEQAVQGGCRRVLTALEGVGRGEQLRVLRAAALLLGPDEPAA